MQFRQDINGLRAIAVVAVVLFHFNSPWFPGGFAGVDVFFVISGYLMTGIIFKGIEKDTFSILKFYISRANRIIPPLAVLCFFLLIFGYFFLTSWDYKTVGRDVATSMSFTSSIMFSLRGGYFEAVDNFLLHTWSLSTEWQFYMIYPVLLVFLSKLFSVRNIKIIVVAGAIAGYLFSIYSTLQWPAPSYYLLSARAWEMLIGGVAFLYPVTLKNNHSRAVELTGMALVLLSYIFISEENSWPGYLALFPVLGAYLIIIANRQDSIITNNIGSQKIGKWSYSIYLWHWPIVVSYSYYGIDNKYKVIGAVLSIVLGYLSFALIESRKRVTSQPLKSAGFYIILIACFGVAGGYIFQSQGVAQKESLIANSLIQGGTSDDHVVHEGVALLNTESDFDYLLIGDSNSNHYVRGILYKGTKVKSSWFATCLSFPNAMGTREGTYIEWKEDCQNNYKQILETDKDTIIAQAWVRETENSLECTNTNCNLSGNYNADLGPQLRSLVDLDNTNKNIYLIAQLPKPQSNTIMTCLKSEALLGINLTCGTQGAPRDSSEEINAILNNVAADYPNVFLIDPAETLCSNGICTYSQEGKSLFMPDGSHLSGFGSEIVWNFIITKIDAIKAEHSAN